MASNMLTVVLAILMASSSQGSSLSNRATPSGQAMQTLQALDMDGSGTVTKEEVQQFARSQGMSDNEAVGEFADLDTNKDGLLEAEEIGATLDAAQEEESDAPDEREPAPVEQPAQPAVAVALSSTSDNQTVMLQQVVTDVGTEADHIVAGQLAKLVEAKMTQYSQDAKEADSLAATARNLRGNASALAKSAPVEARKAAAQAADAEVKAALKKVTQLQQGHLLQCLLNL